MPDCDQALELISARLDGALSPQEEALLEEHLRSCPDCRALLADFQAIHQAMPEPVEPPPELAEAIMAQVRRQKVTDLPPRRKIRWRAWASLAAVLAVVLVGGGAFRMGLFGGMGGGSNGASGGAAPAAAAPVSAGQEAAQDIQAPAGAPGADAPAGEQESARSAEGGSLKVGDSDQPVPAAGGAASDEAPPPDPAPIPTIMPEEALNGAAPNCVMQDGPSASLAELLEQTWCGRITLPYDEDLPLDGDAAWGREGDTLYYILPAEDFAALADGLAQTPDAQVELEGDCCSPDAPAGLVILTGAP